MTTYLTTYLVIPPLSEAVDRRLRDKRLLSLYRYAQKKNKQSDRTYSRSIGYKLDRSKTLPDMKPGSPGSYPTVRRSDKIGRNKTIVLQSLSKLAKAKAAKAFAIVHNSINKRDAADQGNRPFFKSHRDATKRISPSNGQFIAHYFRKRNESVNEAVDQVTRDKRIYALGKLMKSTKVVKSDYSHSNNLKSGIVRRLRAIIAKHKDPNIRRKADMDKLWLNHDAHHARQSHRFFKKQVARYGKS